MHVGIQVYAAARQDCRCDVFNAKFSRYQINVFVFLSKAELRNHESTHYNHVTLIGKRNSQRQVSTRWARFTRIRVLRIQLRAVFRPVQCNSQYNINFIVTSLLFQSNLRCMLHCVLHSTNLAMRRSTVRCTRVVHTILQLSIQHCVLAVYYKFRTRYSFFTATLHPVCVLKNKCWYYQDSAETRMFAHDSPFAENFTSYLLFKYQAYFHSN